MRGKNIGLGFFPLCVSLLENQNGLVGGMIWETLGIIYLLVLSSVRTEWNDKRLLGFMHARSYTPLPSSS